MLPNLQNVGDFENLRVTKISTNKRLRVRILMHPISPWREFAGGKNLNSKTLQVH